MHEDSSIERAFDTQLRALGSDLPVPEKRQKIIPGRKYEFDRIWRHERLIVELEGGAEGMKVRCHNCNSVVKAKKADGTIGRELRLGGWHQGRSRFESDKEKYNLAAKCGWMVLRFTNNDVYKDPFSMVELIRTILKRKTPSIFMVDHPSEREMQVLYLISAGYVTREIAEKIGITENTVRSNVQNLNEKFIVKSRSACVARAMGWGVLNYDNIPFPEEVRFSICDP